MTKVELIKALEQMPDDMEVFFYQDSEYGEQAIAYVKLSELRAYDLTTYKFIHVKDVCLLMGKQ